MGDGEEPIGRIVDERSGHPSGYVLAGFVSWFFAFPLGGLAFAGFSLWLRILGAIGAVGLLVGGIAALRAAGIKGHCTECGRHVYRRDDPRYCEGCGVRFGEWRRRHSLDGLAADLARRSFRRRRIAGAGVLAFLLVVSFAAKEHDFGSGAVLGVEPWLEWIAGVAIVVVVTIVVARLGECPACRHNPFTPLPRWCGRCGFRLGAD